MREDLTFTLTEETEKKLYEIMYSMDVKNTPRFWIKDKHGYSAFYEKVIHCKDCKYFTRDTITGVTIPGSEYCIFTMNNRIEEDDFCSRAERKEE